MVKAATIFSNSSVVKYLRHNRKELETIKSHLEYIKAQNTELLLANIFRDSIQDSPWLTDKSFSPYQAAANYSLLYKLFKVYDVIKPKNVLEFGLGQTTKLSSQYARANTSAMIVAVDDDPEWVGIYKKQTQIPKNMRLITLGLQDLRYKGKTLQKLAEYADLDKTIGKTKFNLIIIDGPIGYDKEYSRPNILSLIDNLANSWIVVFDDAGRLGEQNTIRLFREKLSETNTEYADFTVSALKTQHWFCSRDNINALSNI